MHSHHVSTTVSVLLNEMHANAAVLRPGAMLGDYHRYRVETMLNRDGKHNCASLQTSWHSSSKQRILLIVVGKKENGESSLISVQPC